MAGKAYITILGRSVWAVVNTYYAVLRERRYFPDKIYVFTEEVYEDNLGKVVEAIKILSEEFGFNPYIERGIVDEADFVSAGKEIFAIVKNLKENNFTVAIDITPGRKALVAAALIPAIKMNIEHVFYLSIKNLDNVSKPYMMIPLQIQHLRDFAEEEKR